jgi:hypothetical protein
MLVPDTGFSFQEGLVPCRCSPITAALNGKTTQMPVGLQRLGEEAWLPLRFALDLTAAARETCSRAASLVPAGPPMKCWTRRSLGYGDAGVMPLAAFVQSDTPVLLCARTR